MKKKILLFLTIILLFTCFVPTYSAEIGIKFNQNEVFSGSFDSTIDKEINIGPNKSYAFNKIYVKKVDITDTLNLQFSLTGLPPMLMVGKVCGPNNATNTGFFANNFTIEYLKTMVDVDATREQLLSIGFKAEELSEKALKFYLLGFQLSSPPYNGKDFAILIEVESAVTITEEQKAPLKNLLDTVTGENEKNWVQTGDRYNGKDYISDKKGGFWKDFVAPGGPREKAQNILAAPPSVEAINQATDDLQKAIDKLIPTSQVNATELYEKIEHFKDLEKDKDSYLPSTFQRYKEALDEARAALASLFDQGVPTEKNKAANQKTLVDDPTEKLSKRVSELLFNTDYDKLQQLDRGIANLARIYNYESASGFTEDSYLAYTKARDEALTYRRDHPVSKETSTGMDLREYRKLDKAFRDAVYHLKATTPPTVTVRLTDDYGLRHPNLALYSVGQYRGEFTLTRGTLGELLEVSKISGMSRFKDYGPNRDINWIVYINGVAVRGFENYEKNSLEVMEGDGWKTIELHNGDHVVVARQEQAMKPEGWSTYSRTDNYNTEDSLGMLRFTDATPVTVKEGEAVNLSVEWEKSFYSRYTGKFAKTVTATLAAYGPKNPDGTYPKEAVLGDTVSNGEPGSIRFNKMGTYLVTAFDPRENDIKNEVFHSLKAGAAPVEVTVTAPDPKDLEKAKAEAIKELESEALDYGEDALGAENAKKAQEALVKAKKTIAQAKSFSTVEEAKNEYHSTIKKLKKEVDNRFNASYIRKDLRGFPSLKELEEGKTYYRTLGPVVVAMKQAYEQATLDQAQELTFEETAHLKKLIALYGTDGSNLPNPGPATIRFRTEKPGQEQYLDINIPLAKRFEDTTDAGYNKSNKDFTTLTDLIPGYAAIEPNVSIKEEYKDQYEIDHIDLVWLSDPKGPSVTYSGKNLSGYKKYVDIKEGDNEFVYHLKEKNPLKVAKEKGIKELADAFNQLDKPKYTPEGWQKIIDAYNGGMEAIEKANKVEDVTLAKDNAVKAMNEVPKRDPDDLGSVWVTIENTTTFTKKEGAPWDGILIKDVEVPLTKESTMMNSIVKALDLDTEKTGKTHKILGANTGYITSIDELGEFDGGSGAGWMGTLNGWFTNSGFGEFTVAKDSLHDGDQIKIMFTRELGKDIGSGVEGNTDTSLKSLVVTGGELNPAFREKVVYNFAEYTVTIDESTKLLTLNFTPKNQSFQARAFKNQKVTEDTDNWIASGESVSVTDGDVIYIGVGESKWPSMGSGTPTWYRLVVVSQGAAATVESIIDNMPAPYEGMPEDSSTASQIRAAKAAYDALSEESKKDVKNKEKLLKAVETMNAIFAAREFKNELAAIPSARRITWENLDDVRSIVAKYDTLTQDTKDRLSIGEVEKIKAFKKAIPVLEQQAADYVKGLIDAIGEVTLEKESDIIAARTAYDALEKELQPKVDNVNVLTEAEAKLEELKAEAKERDSAKWVQDIIEGLPEPEAITLGDKVKVSAARSGYDALSEKAKSFVAPEALEKLKKAEEKLKELEPVDPEAEDEAQAKAVEAMIQNLPEKGTVTLDNKALIEGAKQVYDQLTPNQKAKVSKNSVDKLNALIAELKALESGSETGHDDAAKAKAVEKLIDSIGTVTLGSGQPISTARRAYDALTEAQKALVKNLGTLTAAEKAYADLKNQSAIDDVKEAISAIGEVTLKKGDAIANARAAYNALTTAQQTAVSNYQTLLDAEAAYNTLVAQEEAKRKAAQDDLKKVLRDYYNSVVGTKEGDYTKETWNAFQAALGSAKRILDGTATEATASEALANLKASYQKLAKKAPVLSDEAKKLNAEQKLLETQGRFHKFTDVKGHWAVDVIKYAVDKGYFVGTSLTTFSPNKSTTRMEFMTVLGRLAGVDPAKYTNNTMVDVVKGAYYEPYVNWGVEKGIIQGVGGHRFAPERDITREEMAVILRNYLTYLGYENLPSSGKSFNDAKEESPWAKESIDRLVGAKVLKGRERNLFRPKASFTRAELAQVIYNLETLGYAKR